MAEQPTIADFYVEDGAFPPPPAFVAEALVTDRSMYDEAEADYEAFWARQARELLSWYDDFDTTLEWELPFAKWFVGGTLNVVLQLPRPPRRGRPRRQGRLPLGGRAGRHARHHLRRAARRGEPVRQRAQGPRASSEGDRVAIYMPMIPELPIAMLACTRIGAAHSVIFGGFSPDAIIDRVNDAEAKVIITADGGYRRGAPSPLKANVDAPSPAHARRSSTSSSCTAATAATSTWSTGATTGGTS